MGVIHIICDTNYKLNITSLKDYIVRLTEHVRVRKVELHCSSNWFVEAAEIIKPVNDSQDEYKVEIVIDPYLREDQWFITDGKFIIFSQGV